MSEGLKIGALVSGGGSNLQSIIDSCEAGRIPGGVVVVISNVAGAYGLERAKKHNIPSVCVPHQDFPDRVSFEDRLIAILREHEVGLVVLAGFMRLLTPHFLKAFPGRIMNIHPALLPSFPGTHGQRDALRYGVRFSGCTVHFADQGTDTGPIIIQAVVPVRDDDTEETLAARILKEEHRVYPRAIQLFAQGRLKVEGRRVKVSGVEPPELAMHNPPLGD